jgi:hypothetical protein
VEAILAARLIKGENLLLGDDDVGVAVTGEIDELRVAIRGVDVRAGLERSKGVEAVAVRIEAEEALCDALQINKFELSEIP